MKKLYNQDIYVFFRDTHGLRAIFRDKDVPPYSLRDVEQWNKKPKASITFSEKLYSKEELAPHAWNTIVHEVTHYKEDISCNDKWQTYHSDKFKDSEKKNLTKANYLRKKFNKEVGFEEDHTYDESEEDYLDETNLLS